MTKSKRLIFRAVSEFLFDKSTGAIVMRIMRCNGYKDVDIFLNLFEVKALGLPLKKLEDFDMAKFREYYSLDDTIIYDGVRWYNS